MLLNPSDAGLARRGWKWPRAPNRRACNTLIQFCAWRQGPPISTPGNTAEPKGGFIQNARNAAPNMNGLLATRHLRVKRRQHDIVIAGAEDEWHVVST